MDNRPIGIFDSGLGGLTCVKKVMDIMPNEDIIYFGDTGRVPYGTKSPETIVKYVRADINFLSAFDIKLIIIACGTASSAALPSINSEYETNIIGVLEPAAKLAVAVTKNNKVGVLGTSGTIKSGKYLEKIKALNPAVTVKSCACPMFVPIVENGYAKSEIAKIVTEEYLKPMKDAAVDTIILGCTHYPLLTSVIREYMGDEVTLIDSGATAADYALRVLENTDMRAERDFGTARYYVSDTVHEFAELGSMFLDKKIEESVYKIDIEKY
ncbi:MAG: glutamate racemase [Oscillospiraceae bacterium]